jgi:hypothetical protein
MGEFDPVARAQMGTQPLAGERDKDEDESTCIAASVAKKLGKAASTCTESWQGAHLKSSETCSALERSRCLGGCSEGRKRVAVRRF